MVTHDKVSVYPSTAEFTKEHSLGPVQGPVIDTFSNIKNIPKMNASINTASLKFWIKRITIKPLEIVVEGLGTFTDPEVGVCDDRNFTPCQTSVSNLHLDYSRILLHSQVPLPPGRQVSAAYQEPVGS